MVLYDISLEFVGREAPPRLLMKLSTQLQFVYISLSILGPQSRSTIRTTRNPNTVAVDETVIRLGDEQY